MRKLFLLLTALCIFATSALAQNRVVKGEVVSAADGEPLIGATVLAVGTKNATSTDIEGKFVLNVPANVAKLQFSYVGMRTLELPVSTDYMKVSLEESSQLTEVVVTGYGVTKKAAFTGAASTVSGAEIDKKNEVNFVKGLEGNVTGFQYNNSTSMPGQWGSVSVRGMGTLSSSSQPLYVIDGVPISSDPDHMADNNNYFDPMAAYNPNDIESVTVLKDAAATAIYGSRAANGVIIVTTKKGAKGKFEINIDVKQGVTSVANNNMKYANAAETLYLLSSGYAARNGGTVEEAQEMFTRFYGSNYGWDGESSYDWVKKVQRNGYYQDYNISFGGTSGDTHYFASLGYVDSEGIIINSGNKRYSGRLNVDTKYKYFSAGVNASYSYSKNLSFSQSTGGSNSNPMVAAVTSMLPFYPFYAEDGTYFGTGSTYIKNFYNPLAVNDKSLGDLNEVLNQTVIGNPWLRVDLPFGFWAKTNFGINIVNQEEYNYWSGVYNPQGMNYNGLGQKYDTRTSILTWTNTIGWNKTFNDIHSFDVLLGQEMQRYEFHEEYLCKADFPFCASGMRDLTTAASIMDGSYYRSQSRLASYFADAHYSYADRYFLSASYRRDGSSVFGADRRWGDFWSVGAKWRITEESFTKSQTWLSTADLRISYGTVGNQSIGLYASRGVYATGYDYSQRPGITPAQIDNPDLTWETSRKFDVGFDFGIFNRANLTFDFYNEDTADALYQVPLSMTTGLSSYYKNIGKIRNRGIEVGINGVIFTNQNLTVSAYANLTWNKNKVIKLADGAIESTYRIVEEGHPYYQFYMPEYVGVNPENGRALYYLNESGSELTEDYYAAAKRYVGSADPKVYGAFGLNARGYGFDFSIQFNYRSGNKVYDTGHDYTGWGSGSARRLPLQTMVYNSWTPENTNALYPQYITDDPYTTSSGNYSSRWLMDGSFIRLSNLTFGYTIPKNITEKALLQKVRFYVTFDNLHTWTKKSFVGYNPETYESGVIAWQYPAVFTFTGGVQLTF